MGNAEPGHEKVKVVWSSLGHDALVPMKLVAVGKQHENLRKCVFGRKR
jgi:hypothetical protein